MKRFAAICTLTMLVAACEAKSPLRAELTRHDTTISEMFTLTGPSSTARRFRWEAPRARPWGSELRHCPPRTHVVG